MNDDADKSQLLQLTATIVSAHIAKSSTESDALPALIRSVHAALAGAGTEPAAAVQEKPEPAVPVKKSVFPDYIVCLEDGQRLKTMKRHLRTAFQMTPEEYRVRWGLPKDYPMVAPNYAAKRSALAKQVGLGRKRAAPVPVVTLVKAGVRGRKKVAT